MDNIDPYSWFGLSPGFLANQPFRISTILSKLEIETISNSVNQSTIVKFVPEADSKSCDKLIESDEKSETFEKNKFFPVLKVTICGWIVSCRISGNNKFAQLLIDDCSSDGVLSCAYYLDKPELHEALGSEHTSAFGTGPIYDNFCRDYPLGSVVRLIGKVSKYQGNIQMSVFEIQKVDVKQELEHWVLSKKHLEYLNGMDLHKLAKNLLASAKKDKKRRNELASSVERALAMMRIQQGDSDVDLKEHAEESEFELKLLVKNFLEKRKHPITFDEILKNDEFSQYAEKITTLKKDGNVSAEKSVKNLLKRIIEELIKTGVIYIASDEALDVYQSIGPHNLGRDILVLMKHLQSMRHKNDDIDMINDDFLFAEEYSPSDKVKKLAAQLPSVPSALAFQNTSNKGNSAVPVGMKKDEILFEMKRIPRYSCVSLAKISQSIDWLVENSLIYECDFAYVAL